MALFCCNNHKPPHFSWFIWFIPPINWWILRALEIGDPNSSRIYAVYAERYRTRDIDHWKIHVIYSRKKQIPPYPIVSWSTHNSSCLSPWLLLVEFKICIVVVSIYKLYISHRYWLHPVLFIESAYCWFYSSYVLILTQIWYMIEGSLEVNSDNMERWKSSQQGEESEEKKIRRKKMQVREKVGKLRSTVFFRGFVAPEGWKVRSLKRRVRRHLKRWEMKSCTPLWREADFEVKR